MMRNQRLLHFARYFNGKWNAVELAAKGIFSVPRFFHGKKNSLPNGRHPKLERFARGPDV